MATKRKKTASRKAARKKHHTKKGVVKSYKRSPVVHSHIRRVAGIMGNNERSKKINVGKLLLQSAKGSPLKMAVVRILKSDMAGNGYESYESYMNHILQYGCQSGMISELIYYSDTLKWYKKYKKEIIKMLQDTMSDLGVKSPSEVFGSKWDDDDYLIEDTSNQNLLAWFSFEETVRNLGYQIGMEF